MSPELILQLIGVLAPYAMQAGVDIAGSIERINAGESVDDLIAEVKAKRDDLPDLPFKPL